MSFAGKHFFGVPKLHIPKVSIWMLVSQLAQFISCETVLCFLCNFSVTNNDFEHARHVLAHYTLPQKPL